MKHNGKIYGCVIFWNDEEHLVERCLKSLKSQVDEIVAVDGKFSDYPGEVSVESNKQLQRLVREYATIYIEAREWADQIEKRSSYFVSQDPRDFYFILDTDEELEGSLKSELPCAQEGRVSTIIRPDNGMLFYAVRLIPNYPNLAYRFKHYHIFSQDRMVNFWKKFDREFFYPALLTESRILHHMGERTYERQNVDTEYMHGRKEQCNSIPVDIMKKVTRQIDEELRPCYRKVKLREMKIDYSVPEYDNEDEIPLKNNGKLYSGGDLIIPSGEVRFVARDRAKRMLYDFPEWFSIADERKVSCNG